MPGGAGLYRVCKMFGLVSDNVVYLKVYDTNSDKFILRGVSPFQPFSNRSTLLSFYALPEDIQQSPEEFIEWAEESLSIPKKRQSCFPREKRRSMTETNKTYRGTGEDGITRCWWGHEPLVYRKYHDEEWGRPVVDDIKLFEKICLEGFQSGLSWLTILRKRENFREAFAGFDFNKIAKFDDEDVAQLLRNAGIIRHRGKIEATINNALRALEIVDEFGSLARYIWRWEPESREPGIGKNDNNSLIPSVTRTSQLLSKDLKKRGWKFFGPTTAYAFMQAMGLVNDHMEECVVRQIVEQARNEFQRPR